MNNREIIGAKIKELRADNGMTQRDLAKASGMDKAKIANVELGKHSVGIDILCRILDVFDCKITITKK